METIIQGQIQDLQKEGADCWNWLVYSQNRLNWHDLAAKGGGVQSCIGPYLDLPLLLTSR